MPPNGKSFTVIWILPPGFEFPLAVKHPEIWTTIAAEGQNLDERGAQILRGLGRLKQDVTLARARAELTEIAESLAQQYPQYNRNATAYLVSVDEQIVGRDVRRALWVLLACWIPARRATKVGPMIALRSE